MNVVAIQRFAQWPLLILAIGGGLAWSPKPAPRDDETEMRRQEAELEVLDEEPPAHLKLAVVDYSWKDCWEDSEEFSLSWEYEDADILGHHWPVWWKLGLRAPVSPL